MTRLQMSGNISADRAELLSDNEPEYSVDEEAFIAHRADELLAERLNDRTMFSDLMSGIDALEIEPHLHRALLNLDRAIKGETVGKFAVFASLSDIQRRLRIEAETVWRDECRAEAEKMLKEEV